MKKFERTLCGIIILALICGYFVTTSRADVEVPVPEESTTIATEETTEATYDDEEREETEEEIVEDNEETPDEQEVPEDIEEESVKEKEIAKDKDETESKSDEEYKYVGKDSTYEYYVSIENGKLYLANYCKLCGYGDINPTTKSEIENRFGVDVDSLFK